jgi:hypothetical protein
VTSPTFLNTEQGAALIDLDSKSRFQQLRPPVKLSLWNISSISDCAVVEYAIQEHVLFGYHRTITELSYVMVAGPALLPKAEKWVRMQVESITQTRSQDARSSNASHIHVVRR